MLLTGAIVGERLKNFFEEKLHFQFEVRCCSVMYCHLLVIFDILRFTSHFATVSIFSIIIINVIIFIMIIIII